MKNDVSIIIRAFDKTGAGAGSASANLKRVKIAAAAAAAAVTAMAAAAAFAAVRMGKEFIETADELAKLGRRLGVSTEALSTYRHAAELTGVEFGTLATGLQRMTRRVAEAAQGTGEARGALAELGVGAKELNALAPDKQFERIADAMQGVENQSDRVRLAMKLFDTEGVALLQTMEGGAEGLRAMQEEARALGLEISTNTGAEAERFNDNLLRLRRSVNGLVASAVGELLPALNGVASGLSALLTSGNMAQTVFMALKYAMEEATIAMVWAGDTIATLSRSMAVIVNNFEAGKDFGEAWEGAMTSIQISTDETRRKVEHLRAAFNPIQIVKDGADSAGPAAAVVEGLERVPAAATAAGTAMQSFQAVSANAVQGLVSGFGAAVLNAQNLGSAVADLSKGIAQMFINYIAQRLAMFAVEKTMAGIGLASATATAGAMGALGASVSAAWLPAAVAVSLATFGANSGPAVTGMFAAFAAGTAMAAGATVAGGLLSAGGGGLAGQAHSGLDMVPREGTYLLNRGEAVIQPEANQDLREMARSYNAGRGQARTGADGGMMAKINLILDGEVLASGIGRLARSGILEIHPKAVR